MRIYLPFVAWDHCPELFGRDDGPILRAKLPSAARLTQCVLTAADRLPANSPENLRGRAFTRLSRGFSRGSREIVFLPSNLLASVRIRKRSKQVAAIRPPLEFHQRQGNVPAQAKKAGVQPGVIIVGVDDQKLEMTAYQFLTYIRGNYVKGETLTLNLAMRLE